MNDSSTDVSSVVQFRSAKLLLVERDGQPFVPMKPVVDGIGLNWKTQYRKLQSGRFNSVMVMMTTTGADGKQYEMACLPLRKLAGWLMSIHASKVRLELRDGVIAYQNECDDVLWSYWNQGRGNHRGPGQAMTVLSRNIGADGFHMLGSVVKGKVSSLPAAIQRRATAKIWSQVHAAFGVRSAGDIPADQLDSARNFIAAYAVEGEWLSRNAPEQLQRLNIHFPVDVLTCRRAEMLTIRNDTQAWLDVSLFDLREPFRSPCEAVLCELRRAGYEVEGAWWELRTYRNKVESLLSAIRGLAVIAEHPHRYAVGPAR